MALDDSRIFSFNVTNASAYYNGENYSQVQFQIPRFISRHSDNVAIYVSIENATIPSSWYVIDESNNNLMFSISFSSAPTEDYLIEVEPGSYDAFTLATKVNELLPSNLTGIASFLYSVTQNKFGLSWTNNGTGTITALTVNNNSTIAYNMGFEGQTVVFTRSPLTTEYFPRQCNLTGVNVYLIQCDELPVQNYSLQISSNVLGSIQNVAGTFGLTTWQNASSLRFVVPVHREINQLTMRIYDERGSLINFRASPWTLTLKVTYQRNSALPFSEIENLLHDPALQNGANKRKKLSYFSQNNVSNRDESQQMQAPMEDLGPEQF